MIYLSAFVRCGLTSQYTDPTGNSAHREGSVMLHQRVCCRGRLLL